MTNNRMTRPPLLLENFESARTSAAGSGRRWGAKGEKTYASVEIVDRQSHPDIIRSGEHALKFDYDFRYETTQGGSRRAYFTTWAGENDHPKADLSIKDDPYVLVIPEGEYPTHLAMWVYGDANDAWFNGMILDADGKEFEVTCGDLEWTGWKFVIMDIPPRFKLPFYVVYAARMLTGSQTIHGTLYIDEIMALYGGIDFDAVPPSISQMTCREAISGKPGYPVVRALLRDPDDEENGCEASGVDTGKTEITIDGIPHKNSLRFEHTSRGVWLEAEPDFPLCGGSHKLEVVACDLAGNTARSRLFFDVLACQPGVGWLTDASAELGGRLCCRLYAQGAVNDIKVSLRVGYDSEKLSLDERFFSPTPGVMGTWRDSGGQAVVELTAGALSGYSDLAVLEFAVLPALGSLQQTTLVCENAELEVDGKPYGRFCPADAAVDLLPGLCLSVERLCKGYDTLFTVTDAGGLPVPGAKVYERKSGTGYAGETDAQGCMTVPGVSNPDTGTKLDLYARKENRFSLTARYSVSNDLGAEYPENINVTCGKDCTEISVAWQTGVQATEGFIRYALKTPGKTDLAPYDAVKKAERRNNFSTHMGESCEMNGYSVCITGVEPGAEYLYKAGSGDCWSETQVFKTIPAKGDFSFAVLADTHNVCGKAMRAALKSEPDLSFFAHAGDFVSAGGVYDDWQKYFTDAGGLHAEYPTVSAAGNHDLSDGTGANYRLTHSNPPNGVAGAPKGLYYYTELNNTLFMAAGGGYEDDRAIMDWMSDIIQKTSMKWKIVLTHEGPYTCFINSVSEEIKWGDYFNTAGIDLLISGHDHTYQRATIKDRNTLDVSDAISSSAGVTYLQCATSGGASNHDWELHRPIWNAVYDSKTPSATILRVSDEKIQVKVLCVADNAEGFEVYDRFELTK